MTNEAFAFTEEEITLLALQAISDAEAFTKLYRYYFPKVYAFVQFKINLQESDREDIVAEIFNKVLEKLHQYDHTKGFFGAWLFTVAMNHIRDIFRKKKIKTIALDDISELPSHNNVHEQVLARQESIKLKKALGTLPEREQTILSYKFGCGYNNREIAHLMNLSAENVGIIVFRSLRELRTILAHQT